MQSILVCPRFAVLQTRSNHCVTQWCVVVCSGVFQTLTGTGRKKKWKNGRQICPMSHYLLNEDNNWDGMVIRLMDDMVLKRGARAR